MANIQSCAMNYISCPVTRCFNGITAGLRGLDGSVTVKKFCWKINLLWWDLESSDTNRMFEFSRNRLLTQKGAVNDCDKGI